MRIDGGGPALRGLFLDFGQRIVALRLKDQVPAFLALEPDDEVLLEIVRLTVVEIGDREAETHLDEGAATSTGSGASAETIVAFDQRDVRVAQRVESVDQPVHFGFLAGDISVKVR